MDTESAESGDERPRRRLLAEMSDGPRSWAPSRSLVCESREVASGAGTDSRDPAGVPSAVGPQRVADEPFAQRAELVTQLGFGQRAGEALHQPAGLG